MSRNGDYTGVPQTCPLIDKVIDFLDSLSTFNMPDGYEADRKQMEATLEKIRSMNSDLRDFGNKQSGELEEMEKDRDYYEKKCRELQKEIEYKNEEIKDLEKELNQIN